MAGLRRLLGIKSDDDIRSEVEQEPTIKEARKHLAAADAVLDELQTLEDGPPPRPHVRAKNVRT